MTADPDSGARRDMLEPEVLLYSFMRSIGRFTRSGLSGESLMKPDHDDDLDRQGPGLAPRAFLRSFCPALKNKQKLRNCGAFVL